MEKATDSVIPENTHVWAYTYEEGQRRWIMNFPVDARAREEQQCGRDGGPVAANSHTAPLQ